MFAKAPNSNRNSLFWKVSFDSRGFSLEIQAWNFSTKCPESYIDVLWCVVFVGQVLGLRPKKASNSLLRRRFLRRVERRLQWTVCGKMEDCCSATRPMVLNELVLDTFFSCTPILLVHFFFPILLSCGSGGSAAKFLHFFKSLLFCRLSLLTHPDKNAHEEAAPAGISVFNRAESVLMPSLLRLWSDNDMLCSHMLTYTAISVYLGLFAAMLPSKCLRPFASSRTVWGNVWGETAEGSYGSSWLVGDFLLARNAAKLISNFWNGQGTSPRNLGFPLGFTLLVLVKIALFDVPLVYFKFYPGSILFREGCWLAPMGKKNCCGLAWQIWQLERHCQVTNTLANTKCAFVDTLADTKCALLIPTTLCCSEFGCLAALSSPKRLVQVELE